MATLEKKTVVHSEVVEPTAEEPTTGNVDKFETALTVLGNELVRININSESKAKNWVFLSMICLIVVTVMVSNYGPTIVAMFQ